MLASDTEFSQRRSLLQLGNLEAFRDWGHAADFCEAFHLMMLKLSQQKNVEKGDLMTYVVATGQSCTVRQFCIQVYQNCGFTSL